MRSVRALFVRLPGVGPALAAQWYGMGFRSYRDLDEGGVLGVLRGYEHLEPDGACWPPGPRAVPPRAAAGASNGGGAASRQPGPSGGRGAITIDLPAGAAASEGVGAVEGGSGDGAAGPVTAAGSGRAAVDGAAAHSDARAGNSGGAGAGAGGGSAAWGQGGSGEASRQVAYSVLWREDLLADLEPHEPQEMMGVSEAVVAVREGGGVGMG